MMGQCDNTFLESIKENMEKVRLFDMHYIAKDMSSINLSINYITDYTYNYNLPSMDYELDCKVDNIKIDYSSLHSCSGTCNSKRRYCQLISGIFNKVINCIFCNNKIKQKTL